MKIFKKTKNFTRLSIVLYIMLAVLCLCGCADNEIITNCLEGHVYGFWGGIWHGIIAPFDFIGMLIWDDVAMYAPNNNGGWYALGFLLGSGGCGVLASRTTKK